MRGLLLYSRSDWCLRMVDLAALANACIGPVLILNIRAFSLLLGCIKGAPSVGKAFAARHVR